MSLLEVAICFSVRPLSITQSLEAFAIMSTAYTTYDSEKNLTKLKGTDSKKKKKRKEEKLQIKVSCTVWFPDSQFQLRFVVAKCSLTVRLVKESAHYFNLACRHPQSVSSEAQPSPTLHTNKAKSEFQ